MQSAARFWLGCEKGVFSLNKWQIVSIALSLMSLTLSLISIICNAKAKKRADISRKAVAEFVKNHPEVIRQEITAPVQTMAEAFRTGLGTRPNEKGKGEEPK